MRILITDDHALFRQGLAVLLQQLPEISEVQTADSGKQTLALLQNQRQNQSFDLILMDIDMPEMNGIDTVTQIRKQKNNVPIVALSISARPYDILHMYDAGINGYLLKSSSIQEVRKALQQLQQGHEYYCEEIRPQLFELLLQRKPHTQQQELTNREKEVLVMICQQYSTEEIAQALYVSPLTINNHRRSILRKTHSKNVAGLVLYALEKHIFIK